MFSRKAPRDSSENAVASAAVRPGSVDCPVVRVESSFRENSMVIVKNEEWKYVNELETMVSEDVEC